MGLIPKLITESSGSPPIRNNPLRGIKSSPIAIIASNLQPRQSNPTFTAIPSTYGQTNGPSPGAVAGIVLGAVAAFLLLLYLIYAVLHGGPVVLFRANPPPPSGAESSTGSRSVVSFRTRETGTGKASRRGSKRKSKRSSRAETVEVRRSRGTPVTIVDPPAPPPPPAPPRTVSSLSYDDEIDVVVVEEEHTPPRRTSQRGFRRDSRTYRDADPEMFVGDDDPEFDVRRGSRYGRERY